MPFAFDDYVAPAALRNGHRMTIFAWARPRRFPRLPPPVVRLFDVAPKTRLLAKCHWQVRPGEHPTLLLLHGLEGSADAHYMRGIADKGWAAGFNLVRLNHRNCGGTDHLSEGVYHSGLTADPMAVIRELIERDGLPSIVVAGYSLGGNLAARMAGEYGEAAPRQVKGFAAVSPTIDLPSCADALERLSNRLYQWNFVRDLKGRVRRKARLFPALYPVEPLRGLRTVRQFDEAYTAPMSGFRDASDYYHRASALRVIARARVPTLLVVAGDDPFVPVEPFRHPDVAGNPHVTVIVTRHGGHCGFIEAGRNGHDGYWAERAVVAFAAAHA
ncbi:MAG TPA: alpha/beta fold hydrolase [Vicinamibacterales bacterium]|nr:alpha/beta fold hydrolase [Vicinamibacterales bacterium]